MKTALTTALRLFVAAATLAGCTTPSDLPVGTWEFSPNTMRFRTEIGRQTTRELIIQNNSDRYLEVEISRPISSGACPDEPFDLPSFVRVAPESDVALRVEHAPTSWTDSQQCVFQVKLVNRLDNTTDERSVLLVGEIVDVDNDGDGAFRGRDNDCNDHAIDPLAALQSPFRRESCNGYDDDCDGSVDDADNNELDQTRNGLKRLYDDQGQLALDANGLPIVLTEPALGQQPYVLGQGTWFPDNDGDGWPSNVEPDYACSRPPGYAPSPCGEPAGNPRACVPCVAPGDPAGCVDLAVEPDTTDNNDGWDCNDQSIAISPGSFDIVGDGVDRSCDARVTCFNDLDNDGWGDAFTLTTIDPTVDDPYCRGEDVSATPGDCDDVDPDISPGAVEQCDPGDAIDEDCDLLVDDADPFVSPGTLSSFYPDEDGDGFGNAAGRLILCHDPSRPGGTQYVSDNTDCADNNDDVRPGADERCNNLDDNCDGILDLDAVDETTFYRDRDGDGFGDVNAVAQGEVATSCFTPPVGYSPTADDCADNNAEVRPFRSEVIANNLDDNCDGYERCFIDEDQDGYGKDVGGAVTYVDAVNAACPVRTPMACYVNPDGLSPTTCTVAAQDGDCRDLDNLSYPGAQELCDNIDNDCDQRLDQNDPDLIATANFYRDRDGDGQGDPQDAIASCAPPLGYVVDGTDCDDGNPGVFLDPTGDNEIVGNGVDESCDNYELCWPDADRDGFADRAATPADAVLSLERDVLCQQGDYTLTVNKTDCDDAAPNVNPGAVESCDGDPLVIGGVDENCNGLVDDFDRDPIGVSPWYPDQDNDGWGGTNSLLRCDRPAGFVARSGDCNDGINTVNPTATEVCDGVDNDCNGASDDADGGIDYTDPAVDARPFYPDNDGDGFGVAGGQFFACERPTGASPNPGDCDDANPDVKPAGVADIIADGIDQDCDGLDRCYQDLDGDGWGTRTTVTAPIRPVPCSSPNVSNNNEDCDDARDDVAPDQIEVCDGRDNDCDRRADDLDDDITYDPGVDDLYRPDRDSDGFGDQFNSRYACAPVPGYVLDAPRLDCNDLTLAINPDAVENAADGVDQDCDGDELCPADADGDRHGDDGGAQALSPDLSCNSPGVASVADDCDDAQPTVYPGAPERCAPAGRDEDCDGLIDDNDSPVLGQRLVYLDNDGDGTGSLSFTAFRCVAAPPYVNDSQDCDDNRFNVRPPSSPFGKGDELCNGRDDDCDNLIDDADGDRTGPLNTYFSDVDFDGYGDATTAYDACDAVPGDVRNGDDCDDSDPGTRPGATEVLADGVDQNCDGLEVCYCDKDNDTIGSGQTIRVPDDPAAFDDCETYVPAAVGIAQTCEDPEAGAAVAPGDCNDRDPNTGLQATPWFLDNDGDQTGNPAVVIVTCEQPSPDWVSNSDDCNDNRFEVRPDTSPFGPGVEICNNLDDDCDGLTDDADPTVDPSTRSVFYLDNDFDQFGDPGSPFAACAAPFGYVRNDVDCDDGDPSIRPGVPDLTGDDVDQDCDGFETCYCNKDGDQFGDSTETIDIDLSAVPTGCRPPLTPFANPQPTCTATGVARVGGDCNDRDKDTNNLPSLWFADADGDGFGSNALFTLQCEGPVGWVTEGGDCDDADEDISPDATEICDAANVDEDCDGRADDLDASVDRNDPRGTPAITVYDDNDGDGWGDVGSAQAACDLGAAQANREGDCDDGDPFVNEGAREVAADSIDNDCDGLEACYCDKDRDGIGISTQVDIPAGVACGSYTPPPGGQPVAPTCAPADRPSVSDVTGDCNDTDPLAIETAGAWFYDGDGDGYGDTAVIVFSCAAPGPEWTDTPGDCDDFNDAVNPGEAEVCNGVDDDCEDGADDGLSFAPYYPDNDDDGFGTTGDLIVTCDGAPPGFDADAGDCDDGDPLRFPGANERCNRLDDDCDGGVDEGVSVPQWVPDLDGDGHGAAGVAPFAQCTAPPGYINDTTPTDCDDFDATQFVGATERCNGEDDDCDTQIDEGVTTAYVPDFDADGHGAAGATPVNACAPPAGYIVDTTPTDCDDLDPDRKPGAAEVCNDLDDDCDTQVDEGLTIPDWQPDNDGDGARDDTKSIVTACQAPDGYVAATAPADCDDDNASTFPGATEWCNAVDDDCDGAVDLGAFCRLDAYRFTRTTGNPAVTTVYQMVDDAVTWEQADATCATWGYHLLFARTNAEGNALGNAALSYLEWVSGGGGFDGVRFWMGYSFDTSCDPGDWASEGLGVCAALAGDEVTNIGGLTGLHVFGEVDEDTPTTLEYNGSVDVDDEHRFICEAPPP